MKPYNHQVHELDGKVPGKRIATIEGKASFKKGVMKRYFEDSGIPVCFRLEGNKNEPFYEVIPFPIMQGKNKGAARVVFVKMGEMYEDADDIPF